METGNKWMPQNPKEDTCYSSKKPMDCWNNALKRGDYVSMLYYSSKSKLKLSSIFIYHCRTTQTWFTHLTDEKKSIYLFQFNAKALWYTRNILDFLGFWRWCVAHRVTGFLDLSHRPVFSKGLSWVGVFSPLHLRAETDPVSEVSCFYSQKRRTMEEFQKPSNSVYKIFSSAPCSHPNISV
jgi:hypothetical protein